jgi:voltage-gated potassium channel
VEGRVEDELRGSVQHSLVRALACVPGFDHLDDPTLLQIAGASSNLLYPSGSVVFDRGDDPDALYIVLAGAVRLGPGDGGPEVTLGAGDYFGEMSMLLDTPRTRKVWAVEDCELLVLPQESFHRVLSEQPELDHHVRAKLQERLAAAPATEDAARQR